MRRAEYPVAENPCQATRAMDRVLYVLRAFPEPTESFVRTEVRALGRLNTPTSILTAQHSDPPAEDWTRKGDLQAPVATRPEPGIPDPRTVLTHATSGPFTALRLGRLAKRAELASIQPGTRSGSP